MPRAFPYATAAVSAQMALEVASLHHVTVSVSDSLATIEDRWAQAALLALLAEDGRARRPVLDAVAA